MSFIYRARHDDENGYGSFKQAMLADGEAFSNGIEFAQPPRGIKPKEFVDLHFGANSSTGHQFLKGTTTLAFVYEPKTEKDKGGVVVAVDSRASSGEYISMKKVMKILPVGDRMVATMAGGAADCQFWTRTVHKFCNLYELREKKPITVSAASKYFANCLYAYRGMGISVGSIVGGIDQNGPSIFWVDSEGFRERMPDLCSVGSGSIAAYGVLDTYYNRKMTDKEALDLGRRAIMHATFRDIGSGNYCNVAHITPEGRTIYDPFDISEYNHKYYASIGKEMYSDEILKDD